MFFVFLFKVILYYKLMPKGSFVSEFLALRTVIHAVNVRLFVHTVIGVPMNSLQVPFKLLSFLPPKNAFDSY